MKKTIATVGILSASLVAYFAMNTREFVPAPLDFNGQIIEMTHTDDNEGEDLIIYTDKATYSSWDTAEVIFSVTNLSSKGQNVTKRFLYGKTEQTDSIEEYIADVPYTIVVDDYAEKETCEFVLDSISKKEHEFCSKKKLGSHEETYYRDTWVNTYTVKGEKPSDYDNQERIGKVLDSKYKTDSESTTYIESGETKYYRAIIKFEPPVFKDGVQEPPTEFYIEATGDLGSFGNLDPWYSGSWTYRKQIDINPNYVSGSADLSSFPYLVDITDANLASNAQADGDDILFTSSDGTTKLDHEIEIYTSGTGRLTSHVRIPTLSYNATTTIYMYYGNSGASSQQNATGVWDVSFQGVYHANDNAANTTVNDSTANNYDGTNAANTSGKTVTGKVGTALTFNGTSDSTALPNIPAINGVASTTISLWYNPTTLNDYDSLLVKTNASASERFGMQYGGAGHVNNSAVLFLVGSGSNTTFNRSPSGFIAAGTWQHIVVVFDGTETGDQNRARMYKNGVVQTTTNNVTIPALTTTDSTNVLKWALDRGSYSDGIYDEVRVSNSARTADWIATEYNNQSATTTFQIFGTQETDTGGGGGVNITSDLIMFE